MTFDNISYEVIDGIARILQDRPQRRNAQSSALLDELDQAIKCAVADEAVRVIVLGGAGDHFSAGHDLKDEDLMNRQFVLEERYDYEQKRFYQYCLNIWDAPKPVIAQVQGACLAGAFMVANMCDLVVASDDAYFADPVTNAFGVAAVEVLVHPWVMGLRKAKQMLFTGARMSAAEAHAIGMVNEVVPRAELEAATMAMALQIAKADPFGLRLVKRSLNRTADIQGFRAALDAHFDTHQLSHQGTAYQALQNSGGNVAGIKNIKAQTS